MELSPVGAKVFGAGISHWNAQKAGSLNKQETKIFNEALDEMGQLSSKAQELTSALTTANKVRESADVVYVLCDKTGETMQGFLRLGQKHLFLYPDDGRSMFEEDVLCLLDFYVHECVQRQGVGRDLFTSALKREGLTPTQIAYDRPSPKLGPFLGKHFGLWDCLDQPNRFMVFKEFFGGVTGRSRSGG